MSDMDPGGDPTQVDVPVTDPTETMPAAAGGEPPAAPPPTGEPPDEPPDRRPLIIAIVVALIALAGLGLWLLRDDDDTTATDSSTTTVEDTTTTEAPTTTAAPTTAPTTTTTTPPPTVAPGLCTSSGPNNPGTTAEVVYQAYTLGDRDCASKLMTPTALDELFSIPGGGGGWTFAGCQDEDQPDPHTLCSYTFTGGSTGFRMNYSDTDGWQVYEVFQVAD
jgi:hypothetical protein